MNLLQVLNQLSGIGCLAVFIAALQDDCDVEVSKTAVNLIKNFVEMLKQYKITAEDLLSIDTSSPKGVGSPRAYGSPQNSYFSSQNSYISPRNSPKRYDTPPSVDSQYNSATPCSQMSDHSSLINQDSIIDEILDAQDMKLLESVFNSTDAPLKNSVGIKKRTVLNPSNFLEVVSSNFEGLSIQKAHWIQEIDNFNSLMDDILSEYEPGDLNSMDCY